MTNNTLVPIFTEGQLNYMQNTVVFVAVAVVVIVLMVALFIANAVHEESAKKEAEANKLKDEAESKERQKLKKEEQLAARKRGPLSQMIARWKKFECDHINDSFFSDDFPSVDPEKFCTNGLQEIRLPYGMTSNDAIAFLGGKGLKPASIEQLLAWGEKHPDNQRNYRILALGTIWNSYIFRYVPYLGEEQGRKLGKESDIRCSPKDRILAFGN